MNYLFGFVDKHVLKVQLELVLLRSPGALCPAKSKHNTIVENIIFVLEKESGAAIEDLPVLKVFNFSLVRQKTSSFSNTTDSKASRP